MKKSWLTGLAAGILGLSLTVSAGAAVPFVIGDLTGDGNVTAEDSALLSRYFAGYFPGKIPFDIDKADVDGDGYLTRQDGMRLARYADGWKGYEMDFESHTEGLVLYLRGGHGYTGYPDDDSYLLGATTYEVSVVDLLTGEPDIVLSSSNSKIADGHIYRTVDGSITEDVGLSGTEFNVIFTEIYEMYPDDAEYLLGYFSIYEDTAELFFGEREEMSAEEWLGTMPYITSHPYTSSSKTSQGLISLRGEESYSDGIIGDIVYRYVEFDAQSIVSVKEINGEGFRKLVKGYDSFDYTVWFVYDIDGNMVCYLAPTVGN